MGEIQGHGDVLAQVLDAAGQVSMPSDAYGVLRQPSTVLLRPVEQWELDTLSGSGWSVSG